MIFSLTLFHDDLWLSPFVTSVYVTLKEKGIPFSTEAISLADGEQRKPPFAHDSITARIPAIRLHLPNGKHVWVSESTAIVEYLEECFVPPLFPRVLPVDTEERARARQVMGFVRTDVREIPHERPTSTLFYPERREGLMPLTERGRVAMARLLVIAERFVSNHRTTVCSEWSIADADLTLLLQRLALNGERLTDKLKRYVDANWSRPSMQSFIDLPRGPYHDYV